MSVAKRVAWQVRRLPEILGFLAFLAVLVTIDGPGVTVDEPLDVRPGREYLRLLATTGTRFFSPEVVARTYGDNKEHPPLGRWLLGIASRGFEPFEVQLRGADPVGLYIRSARVAPAICFGLLVVLVARAARELGGTIAGLAAGLTLIFMPRMFGHAHMAALDMFVATSWTAALFAMRAAVDSRRPVWGMLLAGLCWGVALLVKIHAWLLPPIALVYAIWRLGGKQAVPALGAWTLAGLAVFFAGWPWLWYDTWPRLNAYLLTVVRSPTLVLYFGSIYKDINVPWHYPWLYFFATVPHNCLIFGIVGAALGLSSWWHSRSRAPQQFLYLGAIALWLILFSTRVPVYDGERLFLPAFALWAVFIGIGFGWIFDELKRVGGRLNGRRFVEALLLLALASQSIDLFNMSPCWLSYYNVAVGGLAGANRLGLEATYWSDAVDNELLNQLVRNARPGDACVLAPSLAPGQGLVSTTPGMIRNKLFLRDQEELSTAQWVVVHRREAYWTPEIRALVEEPPVYLVTRRGVWLAGIWRGDPQRQDRLKNSN